MGNILSEKIFQINIVKNKRNEFIEFFEVSVSVKKIDNMPKSDRIIIMKRFFTLSIAISSIILALFTSCTKKAPKDDKEITLVMAEVNPIDTVAGKMDEAFKNKVEELSNGKIKIDLHCSGVLGDEKHVMSTIMGENSSIHLIRGPANLSSYSGGKSVKSSLLSIPYTFKNDAHFWKFASSSLAQEILDEPYKSGLGLKDSSMQRKD